MPTKLIVGLGNPESKYEHTRHNVGFLAVDYIRAHGDAGFSEWKSDKKNNAITANAHIDGNKIILAKPQTYMNNSGQSVRSLMDYFDISIEDILIIHDDIDIAFGEVKHHSNRGSAGHNGINSIIEHVGTKDFSRVRVGVLPEELDKSKTDMQSFVLKDFSSAELDALSKEQFPDVLKILEK